MRFSNRFSYRFKSFSGAVSFCRRAALTKPLSNFQTIFRTPAATPKERSPGIGVQKVLAKTFPSRVGPPKAEELADIEIGQFNHKPGSDEFRLGIDLVSLCSAIKTRNSCPSFRQICVPELLEAGRMTTKCSTIKCFNLIGSDRFSSRRSICFGKASVLPPIYVATKATWRKGIARLTGTIHRYLV